MLFRSIQNADLAVDVFLSDNSPEDLTAEKMQWLFPGVTVISQKENVGFGRANNAVIPSLRSKYHLIMNPDVPLIRACSAGWSAIWKRIPILPFSHRKS